MSIRFKNLEFEERFSKDYYKVVEFLERINQLEFSNVNFLWGRWAWMISRPVDDEELRNKIGSWLAEDTVVALATFELTYGEVFIAIDTNYKHLLPEVFDYAKKHLSDSHSFKIIINDRDKDLQKIARTSGMKPTQSKEKVSILYCNQELEYELATDYKMISMDNEWSWEQYNRVMWRGFNHEGEPNQNKEDLDWRKCMLSSPHLSKDLCIAIVCTEGNYVSHCCLWYLEDSKVAYVEPVATDPLHRKKGLAKAALYEAINRVRKKGATKIIVGSSQQFYYNIGFNPFTTDTWWSLV